MNATSMEVSCGEVTSASCGGGQDWLRGKINFYFAGVRNKGMKNGGLPQFHLSFFATHRQASLQCLWVAKMWGMCAPSTKLYLQEGNSNNRSTSPGVSVPTCDRRGK
jgi:hypothetical protein